MKYFTSLKLWILKNPTKIIRPIVLLICIIVVVVQLTTCYKKILNPPISTHSYYVISDTVEMPAITICREPPYKSDILQKISGNSCTHPKYVNACFRNYAFGEVPLDDFFMNATYNMDETFWQYGLDGDPNNLDVTSKLHFYNGLCYTLRPKKFIKRTGKLNGYSVLLNHHVNANYNSWEYELTPGWNFYLHDAKYDFTEINPKGSERIEHMFIAINEEIEIKLQNQQFSNIATNNKPCITSKDYNDIRSSENVVWQELYRKANCSGPWMKDSFDKSTYCDNYLSLRNLTSEYSSIHYSEEYSCLSCAEPCDSQIFTSFIQSRKSYKQVEKASQVWIYFTTKLTSLMTEGESYDYSQFIAEISGSLSFLLGISVLGIIGILENLLLFFCGGVLKSLHKTPESPQKDNISVIEKSNKF